jgi:cytochrome b involved in lipid metabolism
MTDMKSIKLPTAGTLFDYYVDPHTAKFEPWTKKVPKFEFDPEQPLQVCVAVVLCTVIFACRSVCGPAMTAHGSLDPINK